MPQADDDDEFNDFIDDDMGGGAGGASAPRRRRRLTGLPAGVSAAAMRVRGGRAVPCLCFPHALCNSGVDMSRSRWRKRSYNQRAATQSSMLPPGVTSPTSASPLHTLDAWGAAWMSNCEQPAANAVDDDLSCRTLRRRLRTSSET